MQTTGSSFTGLRIVLAVTGSIAAYKAVGLLRRLQQESAKVNVVMTAGACRFVTPLTFEVLSGAQVATDLPRLLAESAAGATIELTRLPIAPAARAVAAALEQDALAWATGGGEDYELLVTCERAAFERLRAGLTAAAGTTLTAVGEIRGGARVRWVGADGRDTVVTRGFEHFSRA